MNDSQSNAPAASSQAFDGDRLADNRRSRFGMVPTRAVGHVSHAEMHMLVALSTYADETGWCWPSVPLLAEQVGVSERQARKLLAALVAKGMLRKHSRYRDSGKQTSNMWLVVMDPPADNLGQRHPDGDRAGRGVAERQGGGVAERQAEKTIGTDQLNRPTENKESGFAAGRVCSDPFDDPIDENRDDLTRLADGFTDRLLDQTDLTRKQRKQVRPRVFDTIVDVIENGELAELDDWIADFDSHAWRNLGNVDHPAATIAWRIRHRPRWHGDGAVA